MPRSLAISAHIDLQDFLDDSPVAQDLLRAIQRQDVAIVPPEEGANRVEAHADMGAYLKGRTLRDVIAGPSATPPVPPPVPSGPLPGRRRPG